MIEPDSRRDVRDPLDEKAWELQLAGGPDLDRDEVVIDLTGLEAVVSLASPQLFVTVGTDHHPFDRLIRWVDAWLARSPRPARCLVQGGPSSRPERAQWCGLLSFDDLQARMREATAIVCHAGPGSVMDARDLGFRPIVVPRDPVLGEVVDGHQFDFARRLKAGDYIWLAETEERLHELLDLVGTRPSLFRLTAPARTSEAALRFEQSVARVLRLGA